MINTIIFPSSFFDKKQVDDDLKLEYEAVLSTGLFNTIIFSYDDWFNKNKLTLSYNPTEKINAVYRGWMMNENQYLNFYNTLLKNNITLITKPEQYNLMHIFPNIYPLIKDDTPRIMTFPLYKSIDVNLLKQNFDKFMVKDYVKSVKGTSFPTFFDKDVTQQSFNAAMEIFYKFRGSLITGGICVKEYINLKRYDGKTNEFRAFYFNNMLISLSLNSLQQDYVPKPPTSLVNKYNNLNSNFYTIDFAELENGDWKIIEAGDGSVSGLSYNQDYNAFFRALYLCLN